MIVLNERNTKEYRLVTDGEQLYRIHPEYKLPKGIHEVKTHFGKNVYKRNGMLKGMFSNITRIKPQQTLKKLFVAVHNAIYSGEYFKNAS